MEDIEGKYKLCINSLNSCNAGQRSGYVKEGEGYIKEHKECQEEIHKLKSNIAIKDQALKHLKSSILISNVLKKSNKQIRKMKYSSLKKENESLLTTIKTKKTSS